MAVCKSILSLKVHSPRTKICLVSEEHFNGMFKSTLSAGFSFSTFFFFLFALLRHSPCTSSHSFRSFGRVRLAFTGQMINLLHFFFNFASFSL